MAIILTTVPLQAQQGLLTKIDRQVPAFSLNNIDGETWDQTAFEGKPWVINFWATWCAPCIKELPAFNRAWETFEKEGVGLVAINIGEDADGIKAFNEDVPIDFHSLVGDPVKTLGNWSVRTLPTTLIVDPEGNIVYEALGDREWDSAVLMDEVIKLKTAE